MNTLGMAYEDDVFFIFLFLFTAKEVAQEKKDNTEKSQMLTAHVKKKKKIRSGLKTGQFREKCPGTLLLNEF